MNTRDWRRRAGIPPRAAELVVQAFPDGAKALSEFWLQNELVGRVQWQDNGKPAIAVGIRDGRLFGRQLSFHENGAVSYDEPLRNGLVHGWTRQYGPRGRLRMACPFKHGTGTDYWCDDSGSLSEEHPSVGGLPSGCERWWAGPRAIYIETYWVAGQRHGIARQWRDGRLMPGYPQFLLKDRKVTKSRYLAAARTDASLVPHRSEDDLPERALPQEYQQLRKLARRRTR